MIRIDREINREKLIVQFGSDVKNTSFVPSTY